LAVLVAKLEKRPAPAFGPVNGLGFDRGIYPAKAGEFVRRDRALNPNRDAGGIPIQQKSTEGETF